MKHYKRTYKKYTYYGYNELYTGSIYPVGINVKSKIENQYNYPLHIALTSSENNLSYIKKRIKW